MAAAAGIAAAGSVIGGVMGGKGAKAAAKEATKATQAQIAEAQRREGVLTGLYQPTIDRGNNAGSVISSFLGLEGGDRAAQALGQYRASTGYQDTLREGLGALNANAYARGMGASGATLKALQRTGMSIADRNAGQWLGGLQYLNNAGVAGINGIAGVSGNTLGVINSATQNASDAAGNSALLQGQIWNNTLQNLGNAAGSYFGSRSGSSYGNLNTRTQTPPVVYLPRT